jgi:hypothetical protein
VVAAAAILRPGRARSRWPYALLVAAVGTGSLIQHGPHPAWQAYAHDLPLAGVLAFLAADAASDVTGRRLSPLWWLLPTAAVAPLVAAGPAASTVGQGVLAAAAIGLNLVRAWRRPRLRRILLAALLLLGAGAALGTLGDRTPLCRPESLWQGHAAWHVLAAVALWRVAPAVGARLTGAPVPAGGEADAAPSPADAVDRAAVAR